MSITVTPSMLALVRNMNSKATVTPSMLALVRNMSSKATVNSSIVATVRNMDEELGDFEYHFDTERKHGLWRYEDPGDGRLLNVEKTVVRCNFASRTGVAFYQTQRVACFNIPELATAKDIWVKFDVYAYDDSSSSSMFRCYDETSGQTGIAINPHKSSYSNCVNMWVNGSSKKNETRAFYGFHSIKLHLISDSTNGFMAFYLDDDTTPYYTFAGNVNNGQSFSGLYIQCSNKKALISNLVICNFIEPSLNEVVSYEKRPFQYRNLGTADGLTIAGTTVQSDEYSRTGTAFYQTSRTPCIDVPAMDEMWIKFDLYHKTGSSRFRCYANSNKSTGICLRQYDSKSVDLFVEDTNSKTASNKVIANQIQTYIVHIVSGAAGGSAEVWVDDEKIIDYTYSDVVSPFTDFYLQSDDANNLFSNVFISDTQELLGKLVENHYDIECTITRPNTLSVKTHADTLVTIGQSESLHADIERSVLSIAHFDTFVCRSDKVSYAHFDTKRLISRDMDGLGEGIATCKTIDLGKEMTVGIGINIDGEGYAMIRTAGEDGDYTEWENYVPCERLCRYIDVRLHVRMAITAASLVIDRRTASITLSKHLAAGDNTVEYGEAFYNVPAVIPTAIGDGVTAHVISKTEESCVIKITNSNGKSVEGDVDILIRGW